MIKPSHPAADTRALGPRVRRSLGRLIRGTPDPASWQQDFRAQAAKAGVQRALEAHPNFKALPAGFCVGAYLEKNSDVADAVESAGEAVFHFLTFGIDEGRDGMADTVDRAFLRARYAMGDTDGLRAEEIPARLRAMGVAEGDLVVSEPQLWLSHRVHGPVMAQVFEHEIYYALACKAGLAPPASDRLSCVTHFATQGLQAGLPPHPDHAFDEDFFRSAATWRGLDVPSGDVHAYWAQVGLRAGAHANPRAQLLMDHGLVLPHRVLAEIEGFVAASDSLSAASPLPEVLDHLCRYPWPGIVAFDAKDASVEAFLLSVARNRRAAGDAVTSEAVYRQILSISPANPYARIDLADLIHPQGRVEEEINLRSAVGEGYDGGANGITLAERLLDRGAISKALDVAEASPQTVFGDVALRERRLAVGRRAFDLIWTNLATQIDLLGVPEVQNRLARALCLLTPPIDAPSPRRPIRRVAILTNSDIYQCKLYRADQKADQLRAAGYAVTVYDQDRDCERLAAMLGAFDAVVFARLAAFPRIVDLIVRAVSEGVATFYDVDDLIFDADQFPPPLDTYAGAITALDHKAIACGVPLFRHAMSLCDYGIASTPTIRDAMAPVVRSGRAFLHRNALGAPHMNALSNVSERPSSEKVVVFYGSGTKAHKRDFETLLEPALAQVLAARPGRVEVRIMGWMSGLTALSSDDPDVTMLPPIWDFEAFCAEVARADINLAVLEPSPLTDAKSEIKWLEAAMFGIPTVVSPTALYRDVIVPDQTGLFAETADAFAKQILRLIDDAALRRGIGQAAQTDVMSTYGIEAMGANLQGIFDTVAPPEKPRKTRLLMVNVFFPPQDIGGATRVVWDNVRDLADRYGDAFEIDVITTTEGGRVPYEVATHGAGGARVWSITAANGIETMQVQDHRMGDVFDRLLDRIDPDIVHFHCIQRLTGSVVDTVRRRGLPYAITLHDGWWVSPNQFITDAAGAAETYDFTQADHHLPVRARLTKRWLSGADALLAVSPAFADLHRAAGLAQVEVIENGVSTSDLQPRSMPRGGKVTLGLIGGAARHKGYMLLRAAIEAVKLSAVEVLIVDHAMQPGQRRQDVWNGTPVTFVGRVPLDRVREIYAQIDVLLAPSVWPESYGLVTREALLSGLWVIASDRGAIGDPIVEGENGHIVPVENPAALADMLSRIDANPAQYKTPPNTRTNLRNSQDQADELVAVYTRIRR